MTPFHRIARTGLLLVPILALAACAQPAAVPVPAEPVRSQPQSAVFAGLDLLLTKSPTCTCCTGHEAYLRQLGLGVRVEVAEDINAVKDLYAIPAEMRSCHTSTLGRYFIEGHVPMAAIERLASERPEIDGISLPGMPPGSPGMGGELEGPLTVYAISDGRVIGEFGTY